jgi:hypothetical protein
LRLQPLCSPWQDLKRENPLRSLKLANTCCCEWRPGPNPGGTAFLLNITRDSGNRTRFSLLHLEEKSKRVLEPFFDTLPASFIVSGMNALCVETNTLCLLFLFCGA